MLKSLVDYPKHGQVYVADLNPGIGREMHKKRPVLVVSNNNLNKNTPYVVIIPASSIVPQVLNPEMVFIGKPKGFDKESVFLPLYIRSIDKDRLIQDIGKLSKAKFLEVQEALKLVLGIQTK